MIYFSGDHHFNHFNIIRYQNRPFKTVEEMDQTLIDRWNEVIKPSNIVYHLGDFTLGNRNIAQKYFSQLNGEIHVLGYSFHHDRTWLKYLPGYYSKSGIEVIVEPEIVVGQFALPLDTRYFCLCHYPLAEWDRKFHGSIHLHGHSHGNYLVPRDELALDIGVDTNNFYPYSLQQIYKALKLK